MIIIPEEKVQWVVREVDRILSTGDRKYRLKVESPGSRNRIYFCTIITEFSGIAYLTLVRETDEKENCVGISLRFFPANEPKMPRKPLMWIATQKGDDITPTPCFCKIDQTTVSDLGLIDGLVDIIGRERMEEIVRTFNAAIPENIKYDGDVNEDSSFRHLQINIDLALKKWAGRRPDGSFLMTVWSIIDRSISDDVIIWGIGLPRKYKIILCRSNLGVTFYKYNDDGWSKGLAIKMIDEDIKHHFGYVLVDDIKNAIEAANHDKIRITLLQKTTQELNEELTRLKEDIAAKDSLIDTLKKQLEMTAMPVYTEMKHRIAEKRRIVEKTINVSNIDTNTPGLVSSDDWNRLIREFHDAKFAVDTEEIKQILKELKKEKEQTEPNHDKDPESVISPRIDVKQWEADEEYKYFNYIRGHFNTVIHQFCIGGQVKQIANSIDEVMWDCKYQCGLRTPKQIHARIYLEHKKDIRDSNGIADDEMTFYKMTDDGKEEKVFLNEIEDTFGSGIYRPLCAIYDHVRHMIEADAERKPNISVPFSVVACVLENMLNTYEGYRRVCYNKTRFDCKVKIGDREYTIGAVKDKFKIIHVFVNDPTEHIFFDVINHMSSRSIYGSTGSPWTVSRIVGMYPEPLQNTMKSLSAAINEVCVALTCTDTHDTYFSVYYADDVKPKIDDLSYDILKESARIYQEHLKGIVGDFQTKIDNLNLSYDIIKEATQSCHEHLKGIVDDFQTKYLGRPAKPDMSVLTVTEGKPGDETRKPDTSEFMLHGKILSVFKRDEQQAGDPAKKSEKWIPFSVIACTLVDLFRNYESFEILEYKQYEGTLRIRAIVPDYLSSEPIVIGATRDPASGLIDIWFGSKNHKIIAVSPVYKLVKPDGQLKQINNWAYIKPDFSPSVEYIHTRWTILFKNLLNLIINTINNVCDTLTMRDDDDHYFWLYNFDLTIKQSIDDLSCEIVNETTKYRLDASKDPEHSKDLVDKMKKFIKRHEVETVFLDNMTCVQEPRKEEEKEMSEDKKKTTTPDYTLHYSTDKDGKKLVTMTWEHFRYLANTQYGMSLAETDANGMIRDAYWNPKSGTATIIWVDGTQTVSNPMDGTDIDPEIGFAICIAKKLFKTQNKWRKWFSKVVKKGEEAASKKKDKRLDKLTKQARARLAAEGITEPSQDQVMSMIKKIDAENNAAAKTDKPEPTTASKKATTKKKSSGTTVKK